MPTKAMLQKTLSLHFRTLGENVNTIDNLNTIYRLWAKHYPAVDLAGFKKRGAEQLTFMCQHLNLTIAKPVDKVKRKKVKLSPVAKTIAIKSDTISEDDIKRLLSYAKRTANYEFIISDEFLKSREWANLRYAAIVNSKQSCACCGAKPSDGIYLCVDHIKPRLYYPAKAYSLKNLQVLCNICNKGKGNWNKRKFK